MKIVQTTESAKRPFCLFDAETNDYLRKPCGSILTFKTREEAERSK